MARRGRPPLGVTTTTVRTVAPIAEGYDPRPELDQVWADVANMEPGQALALAFKVRGISHVQLSKIVRGETRKIHRCTPGDPTPEEFENFVVTRWKPGKYELAPVYKGFLLRRRSWVIGGDEPETATESAEGLPADVESAIAKQILHKSGMQVLRELRSMDAPPEEDDVKSTELMMKFMEHTQRTTEQMLAMERERSQRLETLLLERRNPEPAATEKPALSWEALIPVAMAAAARLPAPLMGRVLSRVLGTIMPAEKVAEPASGWTPEAIMTVMQAAGPYLSQLGPVFQGFLGQFLPPGARPANGTVIEHPPIIAAAPPVAPQPSETTRPMPITLSPEGKLALDVAVEFLRQEDYLSAWEALGASQDTVGFLQGLNPDAKPQAYAPLWFGWLGQDLFTQLQGSVLAFIQWSQTHKRELIAKDEEDEDDEPGAGPEAA